MSDNQTKVKDAIHSWELGEHNKGKRAKAIIAAQIGSHTWGLSHTKSDLDVIFVYVRAASSYLTIDPLPQETLPIREDGLDLVGWDLAKFLSLLVSGNPTAQEILLAPSFNVPLGKQLPVSKVENIHTLARLAYDPSKVFMAYRGMAARLRCEQATSVLPIMKEAKRSLRILRNLCACIHVHHHEGFPPLSLHDLIEATPIAGTQANETIATFASRYIEGDERYLEHRLRAAHRVVTSLMELVDTYKPLMESRGLSDLKKVAHFNLADDIFRSFTL